MLSSTCCLRFVDKAFVRTRTLDMVPVPVPYVHTVYYTYGILLPEDQICDGRLQPRSFRLPRVSWMME
jgi:hypothetical protein